MSIQDNSLWSITAANIDPHRYFGLTLGNGMLGIVSDAHPLKVREVIMNGVYDRYKRGRVSNILQGFNPFDVEIAVDGHIHQPHEIEDYQQSLDMRRAVLTTTFVVPGKLRVIQEIRALRALPHTAMVSLSFEPLAACELTVFNHLKAPDHLQQVQQFYAEIDRPHVRIPLMTSVAKSPSGALSLAACNSYIFAGGEDERPELIHEDWDFNSHLVKFKLQLEQGQSYDCALVSSLCSSAHFSDPQNEAERLSIYAKLEGTARLVARHEQAWEDLWRGDIQLDGDPDVQREVRLMLYYLYSSVRAGSKLSLSPVGLSGLGYNGHVFWDTELWMYPPLLMLQPELAKSLLDYRFDRLEAARQNAFTHGFKGAMFPWESADDGTEQTPVWALTGPFQQHISACVGWAFWKYYQRTGDQEWLAEKGYVVLREVATFWCSRVERLGTGNYSISNVIGANEFEENIDNNAFTNGIVKLVLEYASLAAETLGLSPDPDWRHVAENIPILHFSDGTTRENATYEGTEIKQADVNLLAHPLGFYQDRKQIEQDLDFYAPRMSPDGPAMGFATLATIHAQLGQVEQAYEVFVKSYRDNALPPFGVMAECAGGRGVSPYFLTGAGGALQTLLFGFMGWRLQNDGVEKQPTVLPKKWQKLEANLSGLSPQMAFSD